ncbi:MAG: SDR family NAD(P)-dependent oxidoreductase [Desulfobacteraceae bacterium]|nr:SDR family NAD(P)-dependent oxidoreductase [Desulfobacteraceae bacterium]
MPKKNTTHNKNNIAIIGMGCIFPKSRNLKGYWHLLSNGIDAIVDIPDDTHWRLKDYFDQDPSTPDHTYCKRGGFLPKTTFDPLSYGIPPNNIEATDTSQLLGLEVAKMALEDAGYSVNHPILEQKKVNVILGVTGTQELVIPLGARLGHPIWKKAIKDSGISKEKSKEIIQRIQADYVPWQENSFPGLLGNVVAGRIANRLNLSGTNTVADAACASSLSALHTAVMELVSGKCDMSITGGVDTLNDIFMHMCFSKTGVLSHTSDAKPFSKDADGTVLGEGIGMLVLKRLEDAKTDGDRIYAVIKGVGSSSDGRTSAIYAPESKGQLKALKEAYREADIDPSTIELIEAHGTGTRVGDKVEFTALKECFEKTSKKNQTAIGSVKSMIGHTKAAAGAAGIIKTALSLYNKVLPPTLKALEPDPELDINNSSFYLNSESKPWIKSPISSPRRSGVSAFGFGGSNFHVVLEEYTSSKSHISWDGSIQIIAFSANTKVELIDKINIFISRLDKTKDAQEEGQIIAWLSHESRQNFSVEHSYRLLMVHKKEDNIHNNTDKAFECIESGSSQHNVCFSSGSPKGKIGFLFPGQGSQYTGMGKDLISAFPEAMEALENASDIFWVGKNKQKDKPLQDYIFPPPTHLQSKKDSEDQLRDTDIAQPSIGAISLGMVNVLKRFGVTPEITCGHSFGELCALYSAGWIDEDSFFQLAAARGKYMAAAKSKDGDSGSMLAVRASLEEIETLIKKEKLDLILANRNSRNQGVLSGSTEEINRAIKICKQKRIRAIKLPVAAAFHSKLVKNAVTPFKEKLNSKTFSSTGINVLSNTTGTFYGKKESDIRQILGDQLISPVHFVDNIEKMLENNVTTFIEVGPKAVLTGLTHSILKDNNITAISLDASSGKKSGIEDLAHALCMIASKGFFVDIALWEDAVKKPTAKKMKVQLSGANQKPKKNSSVLISNTKPAKQKIDPESSKETLSKNIKPKESRTIDSIPKPKATAVSQNRSALKGSDMTFQNTPKNKPMNSPAYDAMKMVQKGLETMQQIQTQTAQAHEKFLDTQAQASKTLASMLEQTRNLALDIPLSSAPQAPEMTDNAPDEIWKKNNETLVTQPHSDPDDIITPEPDIQIKSPPKVEQTKPTEHKNLNNEIEPILFKIVSKLTGFPVEMLESEMDIESDLGIDSIKKVEIISELEKQIPSCEGLTTENIGSVRTLKEICNAIQNEETDTTETTNEKIHTIENPVPEKLESNTSSQIVSNVLVETISELTGFPVEMLEPSMNLESDLGIDSIKRVEILSKLEQELDHIDTISSDDIANLKTIEEIISYLTKGGSVEPSEAKKKTPASEIEPKEASNTPEFDKKLTRQVVCLKEYPTNQIRFYNGAKIELPANKKVYITKDNSKIAARFKKEFKNIGVNADLIDITKGNMPELSDAAGIVIVPDVFSKKNNTPPIKFLESTFELVKKNAGFLMESGSQKGAFLTTVSFLGGEFGFSKKNFNTDPVYGGLAGLAKTADIEFKNILCRALDMPDSPKECIKNAEAAVSLMMTQGSIEMGLDGDSCNIPTLVDQELSFETVDLTSDDVVVITGGAKGVTAACAIELTKNYSPTIILIGRSKTPTPEPEWAKNIYDAAKLKKAILTHGYKNQTPKPADIQKLYQKIISTREIQKNIKLMEKNGSQVRYFSADIRNSKEIKTIFKRVRKEFKHITAVIHGAGVLKDKFIVDKEIDQFRQVLETKVKGLDAVLSASKKEKLKYLILFSSIAARMGNQGQCDYSMANEILNKTAQKLSKETHDCKFLSINWGPWEGGMVDDSLKKEFSKRGIDLIPLKEGAKQLLKEMGNLDRLDPEIIIGAHLTKKEKAKVPKLSTVETLSFGLSSTPVLDSHKIAGDPVVPFALLMECHAHAAEKNNPGLYFAGIDNMRLLKGVKPGKNEQSIHINLGKCKPNKNGFEIISSITSSDTNKTSFIHSNCTLILKDRLPKPPVLSKAAFMELKPYSLTASQAYKSVLFHGKELQGIKSINGYSKKGIEVITHLAPNPNQWFNKPFNSKWVIEPMMLDAAFQAAILWTYERTGQVCLPGFIANLRLYSSFNNLDGDIRILFTVNEETKNKIKGYFTFLNKENTVIASITGFEAITDPSLNEKFKNKPLFSKKSILAFAQGNPSEAFGDKYKIFDKERQIARLPRPPYFFMDRVLKADHPQWEMRPGGWIETQYDMPKDEWYFSANRTDTIPFCILLEIALQPCGWLAAYAGSALESNDRLHFRNLGGKATFIKPLSRHSGVITIRAKMTDVSKAGGMIIQDFALEVLEGSTIVYQGTTNFGFFTNHALSNQVGIRNSQFTEYSLSKHDPIDITNYQFKDDAPLTPDDPKYDQDIGMPSKALRMIDKIEALSFEAGLYEKGYVKATKNVDPSEWFFDAHFYQDPVCPGSLGVESFLQMIRFFLLQKHDINPTEYEAQMPIDQTHEWIYRGQIIPSNKKIEIHAHIKNIGHHNNEYSIAADGALIVDGICIYEMKDFVVGFNKIKNQIKSVQQNKMSEKNNSSILYRFDFKVLH